MNAIPVPTREVLDIAVYASLTRVLEQCPIQNRLAVFQLMARVAAAELAEREQQYIDDLWDVARDTGLINLLGEATVGAALSVEFGGAR
jgi:hypothetical protein